MQGAHPGLSGPEALLAWLTGHGIEVATHIHPPVFTVEEAHAHTGQLPGAHTKNLFLEDKAGGLWLVTCLEHQTVKINALARLLGAPRLAFAAPARLMEALGVEPGSVTPLALLNDRDGRIRFVLDTKLAAAELLNVHPLRNTATCTISKADFERFLALTGHPPTLLDLDLTAIA